MMENLVLSIIFGHEDGKQQEREIAKEGYS
jgi:hypothetical protein